jgi:hypothetical protein
MCFEIPYCRAHGVAIPNFLWLIISNIMATSVIFQSTYYFSFAEIGGDADPEEIAMSTK